LIDAEGIQLEFVVTIGGGDDKSLAGASSPCI
jgi:hypothetical protein